MCIGLGAWLPRRRCDPRSKPVEVGATAVTTAASERPPAVAFLTHIPVERLQELRSGLPVRCRGLEAVEGAGYAASGLYGHLSGLLSDLLKSLQ